MIYGYARCSTNESRQDIERQNRELKQMGAEVIFFEYASGTKTNREELNNLLEMVQAGDTIVTTEVSRITRSTKHLCDIIELCKQKKIKLEIRDSITVDCTKGNLDCMTNAFLQITGVFAELERNLISDRVKSGIANAQAKGVRCGRATTEIADIPKNFIKYHKSGRYSVTELARLCNISRPTVYKYIKILENGAEQ